MGKENKLLSIVIPSYNMEKYLDRCLSSLIKAPNIHKAEIIVVNDGSKDGTLDIANRYKSDYPDTVSVIDKTNGHYGSCLNAALDVATGKYFRILDADDWFDPDSLRLFIETLDTCDADLVVTNRVEVKETDGGKFITEVFPIPGVEYGKVYDAKSFRIRDYSEGVEFNMHSMTYKLSVLKKIGLHLPTGVCYTDMIYCLKPISEIKSLVAYDINLYHYLVGREGNSTNQKAIKKNFSHIVTVLSAMMLHMETEAAAEGTPVFDNQMRFVNEATNFFVDSLRQQTYVSKSLYSQITPIVNGWKKWGIENRILRKYYFRYWIKYNTRPMLNLQLLEWRLFHPSLALR